MTPEVIDHQLVMVMGMGIDQLQVLVLVNIHGLYGGVASVLLQIYVRGHVPDPDCGGVWVFQQICVCDRDRASDGHVFLLWWDLGDSAGEGVFLFG